MSTSAIIMSLIFLAIVFIVLAFIFYNRASKEIVFVRTGFGGEKIIKSGGAIVIPGLHEVIGVNMNTMRLEVQLTSEQSVITKDRMRVDIVVDFYVHVAPNIEALSVAASTLGTRTRDAAALSDIVEGKFVDVIRSTAAEMTMEELHEKRKAFITRVREAVEDDLTRNGLELEAASLTQLDQTDMSFFNPSNVFDAEGLTRLTEKIESRKKKRNDIEQDTQIQIRNKNLETEKLGLTIEREEHYARLEQQLEVESRKAEQMSEISSRRAEKSQEADQAEIVAKQKVAIAKIISQREIEQEQLDCERSIKEHEIEKEKLIQQAEQLREAEVSFSSQKTNLAKAEAEAARAELVSAEEKVVTTREKEAAQRRKSIELIEAARDAERQALAKKILAEAEKLAAVDQAEAVKTQVEARLIQDQAKAQGIKALNEARNVLTPEQQALEIRRHLIDNLAEIVREGSKPLEKIESIKIIQADGLMGGTSGSNNVFDNALSFKARAPFVDSMLKDLGLDGITLSGKLSDGGSETNK